MASRFAARITPTQKEVLAQRFRVAEDILNRFQVGWDGRAWTAPQFDARRRVVGIHRRFPSGDKRMVTGSHLGLFIPAGIESADAVLAPEGLSDACALVNLGFAAVGRPGNNHAKPILRQYFMGRHAVVVGDNDPRDASGRRPGEFGADQLCLELLRVARSVKLIFPRRPFKDIRDEIAAGLTQQDLRHRIEMTPLWNPSMLDAKVLIDQPVMIESVTEDTTIVEFDLFV